MERIDLLCVGTLKEKAMRELCGEYRKRLSRFCKLTVTEISEARLPLRSAHADIFRALEQEADALCCAAPRDAFRIALCIEGGGMSSERFAETLERGMTRSGKVALFIGSSHGLSERLKDACDLRLSLSGMTFPHQLARCMLLEQVYRAYMIRTGQTYHK